MLDDWQVIHGGDGFYAAIDNVEPWIVYTESQDGFIDRRDMRTGLQRSIRPGPCCRGSACPRA